MLFGNGAAKEIKRKKRNQGGISGNDVFSVLSERPIYEVGYAFNMHHQVH